MDQTVDVQKEKNGKEEEEDAACGGDEFTPDNDLLKKKLGEVTAVLDMDGYMVEGVFRCKEMGWKYLNHPLSYSIPFYHGNVCELNTKDRFSAKYVEENVFDIPYGEFWIGMINGREVARMVSRLHYRGRVAYKGGCIERHLLNGLGIPNINLEDIGCPKINDIILECPFTFPTCGHHKKNFHCPKQEVFLMEWWFNRYMWNCNIANTIQPKVKNPFNSMDGGDFAFI